MDLRRVRRLRARPLNRSTKRLIPVKRKQQNKSKLKSKKAMLCQETSFNQHQLQNHQENLIVIDSSNNEDENDDDKTNSSFKLKLSSSSSLSSTNSSTTTTTTTNSRISTRQSLKTQLSHNSASSASSTTATTTTTTTTDACCDIIIEHTEESTIITNAEQNGTKKCLWYRCNYQTSNENEFMDHIQSKHVFSQKSSKKFRCLWQSCRFYKSPSSRFNWLERHVIMHVDTKPFSCIINDCKRKFQTQASLERHVNSHMKIYESPSKQQKLLNHQLSTSESIKNAPINGHHHHFHQSKSTSSLTGRKRKLIEANKYLKKAKYKDYIDDFTFKFVEQNLTNMNYNSGVIKFKANIIAAKQNENNDSLLYLVEWIPKNILKDEWVSESDYKDTKEVDLTKLKQNDFSINENQFYRSLRFRTNKRK